MRLDCRLLEKPLLLCCCAGFLFLIFSLSSGFKLGNLNERGTTCVTAFKGFRIQGETDEECIEK